MGPMFVFVLLAGRATLSGPEASRQLRDFERQIIAQDSAGGKHPDGQAEHIAFKKKAEELLTGIDLSTEPAEEGLDWANVLHAADRYVEALSILDRFLATKPDAGRAVVAKIFQATDYRRTNQLDKATALLQGLKPADANQAINLAIEDVTHADILVEKSGDEAGIKFLDAVSPAFAAYPNAAGRLDRERELIGGGTTGKILVGQPAPELSVLPDMYGTFTALSSLKGKVVVLDFFAHWCGPCKDSFPDMREMSDALGDKLAVIGVTGYYGYFGSKHEISKAEEFGDMKGFIAEFKIDHPIVYEDRAKFADYNVTGIPEFVLIGKDGRIKQIQRGYDKPSFAAFRQAVVEATK